VNPILKSFNEAAPEYAVTTLLSCCAARRWAELVASSRPYSNEEALFTEADRVWATMQKADWMEAFRAHPRIGERTPAQASEQSKAWSSQEQASVHAAHSRVLDELRTANAHYEELFGFTYIVCATGKSADEMLGIMQRRLNNDRESELREAAEQQRQITQIRLRKWLQV
jgi:2-oxo-4-hydroxy-4-carboxy-5-ureidoimidazoline decarboxylase